jgi:hypothetical protein
MRQKEAPMTALDYYLYYPAASITPGFVVAANELIALGLRLSLLKRKTR